MIHEVWAKPELPRHEQSLTRGIPDASGPSSRQSQQHAADDEFLLALAMIVRVRVLRRRIRGHSVLCISVVRLFLVVCFMNPLKACRQYIAPLSEGGS